MDMQLLTKIPEMPGGVYDWKEQSILNKWARCAWTFSRCQVLLNTSCALQIGLRDWGGQGLARDRRGRYNWSHLKMRFYYSWSFVVIFFGNVTFKQSLCPESVQTWCWDHTWNKLDVSHLFTWDRAHHPLLDESRSCHGDRWRGKSCDGSGRAGTLLLRFRLCGGGWATRWDKLLRWGEGMCQRCSLFGGFGVQRGPIWQGRVATNRSYLSFWLNNERISGI